MPPVDLHDELDCVGRGLADFVHQQHELPKLVRPSDPALGFISDIQEARRFPAVLPFYALDNFVGFGRRERLPLQELVDFHAARPMLSSIQTHFGGRGPQGVLCDLFFGTLTTIVSCPLQCFD